MSESKQEARLPKEIDKLIVSEHMLHGSFASIGCGICIQLRSAILAALDEARDEALRIVTQYHRGLGLGTKDCCDGAVDAALIEVESALKSKRGA